MSSCPICKTDSYRVLRQATQAAADVGNYRSSSDESLSDQLVQCDGCGLVYLNPRTKDEIILKGYAQAIDDTFISENENRVRTFSANFDGLKREFHLKEGAKVLDVGCAGGAFLQAARSLGFKSVGVEPSEYLVKKGRENWNLDIRAGVLESQKFPSNEFDVVCLWDVIEHLTDPAVTLNEIHRVLKSDGYVFVNFPDYGSWARKILRMKWPFFLNVHLFYFTRSTLSRLLKSHGFEAQAFRPYWQTLSFSYVLLRAAGTFPFLKGLASFIEKSPLASIPFTYQMGQTLCIVRKV